MTLPNRITANVENGVTYRVGQSARRLDYENNGTPAYLGRLDHIELEEEQATYWITWDGASAPDPHGTYAFETISEDERLAATISASLEPIDTHPRPASTLRTYIAGDCVLFQHGVEVGKYKNEGNARSAIERRGD